MAERLTYAEALVYAAAFSQRVLTSPVTTSATDAEREAAEVAFVAVCALRDLEDSFDRDKGDARVSGMYEEFRTFSAEGQ